MCFANAENYSLTKFSRSLRLKSDRRTQTGLAEEDKILATPKACKVFAAI